MVRDLIASVAAVVAAATVRRAAAVVATVTTAGPARVAVVRSTGGAAGVLVVTGAAGSAAIVAAVAGTRARPGMVVVVRGIVRGVVLVTAAIAIVRARVTGLVAGVASGTAVRHVMVGVGWRAAVGAIRVAILEARIGDAAAGDRHRCHVMVVRSGRRGDPDRRRGCERAGREHGRHGEHERHRSGPNVRGDRPTPDG